MKKFLTFYLPRLIILVIMTAALGIAGYFTLAGVSETVSGILAIVAIICIAVLAFCYVANPIAARKFKAKLNTRNVKEEYDRMLARAETIRADYIKAKKSLDRLRIGVIVYVVLICLVSAYCIFVGTAIASSRLWLVAAFVLFGVICRIRPFGNRHLFDDYSDPKEYPALHALAKRAADASGVKGKIRIMFATDGSAGVARIGNTISLRIDVVMLSPVREEEFYTILLHEMAHIKNTDTDFNHNINLVSFLADEEDNIFGIASLMFSYPATVFAYETYVYRALASVAVEETADKTMAALSNKHDAANALFKLECMGIFRANTDYYMEKRLYEPEECIPNVYGTIAESFLSKMHEYEGFWRDLAKNEIQPRSASHPILRARLETIGVDDVHLNDPETDGAYREECKKALAETDKQIYNAMSEKYAEKRAEYYLKPLETVEKWEQAGYAYTAENARTILQALVDLTLNERAIEFCTELIEKEKGGLADYAKFMRGSLLLARYDGAGLADIYDAMDANTNYIEEGLEKIGSFCCQMGLQKELEEYRERVITYSQKTVDTEGLSSLSANDILSEENKMPAEIFERNLEYIKRVGGDSLRRIYLVRKKITEEMDSSIYILDFQPESEYETVSKVMNMVFEMLDNSPEDLQYSLFLLDDNIKKAISKVPSCCIYSSDK